MNYLVLQSLLAFGLFFDIASSCEGKKNQPDQTQMLPPIKTKIQPSSATGDVKMVSNSRSDHQNSSPAQRFKTLDDYLAFLEEKGKIDWAYYKLVAPNRYKLMLGRGGNRQAAQYFTRDELMQKFGFDQ